MMTSGQFVKEREWFMKQDANSTPDMLRLLRFMQEMNLRLEALEKR